MHTPLFCSLFFSSYLVLSEIGALVTALGAFYYRDSLRDKMYPGERSPMDTVHGVKRRSD